MFTYPHIETDAKERNFRLTQVLAHGCCNLGTKDLCKEITGHVGSEAATSLIIFTVTWKKKRSGGAMEAFRMYLQD